MITASGIGSGLDVNSIVSQLMSIERRPLIALQNQQKESEARISALGNLKSVLSDFESAMANLSSADKFRKFSASLGDENIIGATADSEAHTGSYSVTVSSLASAHKLKSDVFAQSDTVVGTGNLTISQPGAGNSFTLNIDASNNTLEGIAAAINSAEDNSGVTASVVNGDAGSYLFLSANGTGTENAITVSVASDGDGNDTDNSGLSALTFATEESGANDAVISVDGVTKTGSSNTFNDVVAGLSVVAKKVGVSSIEVGIDNDAIKESVQGFVDAYNTLADKLNDFKKGDLSGDSTVRTIFSSLNEVRNTPATALGGAYEYLTEIGVSITKEGKLELDGSMLDDAVSGNLDDVVSLFSDSSYGFASRWKDVASDLVTVGGVIDNRTDSLEAKNKSLDYSQDVLEHRLEMIEQSYRRRFASLDQLVSTMDSRQQFLARQLG